MTSIAYAALWFFVFAVPWENIVVIPGLGTISKLMGIVALGFSIIAVLATQRFQKWSLLQVAGLLFVLWAGLGLYRGSADIYRPADADWATAKVKTYLQLFLVLWMICELGRTKARQRGLMLAFVLGAGVAALDTIVIYRLHGSQSTRFAAEGFDPNDLAMTLALAIPMAWYLGNFFNRPWLRWLCRGYLLVGLLATLLTGSRGGLVACAMALLVVPATIGRLKPMQMAAALVALLLSGVGALAVTPQATLDRLSSTKSQVETGDMNGRLEIWRSGVIALAAHPVSGYGTGGFERAVRPILGHSQVAHNTYLSVAVEQGLVGLLLFMLMFWAAFRHSLKLPRMDRRFGLILLATLGVAILPLSWDNQKTTWVVLALVLTFADANRVAGRLGAARTAEPVPRQPLRAAPAPVGVRRARGPVRSPLDQDATA